MQVEELLAMLQEKGLDDDQIKGLLKDAMDTLDKDFKEHDEKQKGAEDAEAAERAEASKYLGVNL